MPRGSAPGERRGGRQAGVPNKANQDLREAARAFTDDALKTLADIMVNGQGEQARISAASAILDRGHGKPSQAVKLGGDDEAGPIQQVLRWANSTSEATPDPSKS